MARKMEGIEVGESEVTVSYTLPVFPEGHVGEVEGVLPIIQNGSPIWTKGKTFEKRFALAL